MLSQFRNIAVLLPILIGWVAVLGQSESKWTESERSEILQQIFSRVHNEPDSVYGLCWELLRDSEKSKDHKNSSGSHYYLSVISNWHNQLDSAFFHAQKALEIALQSELPLSISNGYNILGNSFEYLGKLDSALYCFEQSYTYAEIADKKAFSARALLNIGMIYRTKGAYLESLENLHVAKTYCLKRKLNTYLPNLYLTIAEVYLLIKDETLAWENYHASMRWAVEMKKPKIQCSSMLGLGQLAMQQGEISEAECWLFTARAFAKENNITNLEIKANAKLAMVYLRQGNPKLGTLTALAAYQIAKEKQDTVAFPEALYAIAANQNAEQLFTAALKTVSNAEFFAKKTGQSNLLIEILDLKWKVAENANQAKLAFSTYLRFRNLHDSLLNNENSIAIARMEADLIYTRKRANDSIASQTDQIRKEEQFKSALDLERERSKFGIWVAGLSAILTLIAALFVFLFRRQNEKLKSRNQLILDQNIQIRIALDEKELLLKEVHHRVKNNLQILISLFDIQLGLVNDHNAREALLAGQNRMQAMSFIHQRFYQQDNLGATELKTYIEDLTTSILSMYANLAYVDIDYDFDISPVSVEIDIAIPLGIIINELITNSFKHAFNKAGKGKMRLRLIPVGEGKYQFSIEDDGPGIQQNSETQAPLNLGLELVNGLVRQIKGSCTYSDSALGGLKVELSFNCSSK